METAAEAQTTPILKTLPLEVFRKIVSHLDVGDVLSLSQVDRTFRNVLVTDNYLWASRLQNGLKVRMNKEKRMDGFAEIVKRVPTHRCVDCNRMELSSCRALMDPFFRKLLCSDCRSDPKYMLVNAGTARRNYFLIEDDLLPLRMIGKENPYHKRASPIRLYSREQIRALSEQKLLVLGVTREERLEQREERSKRTKEGKRKAREGRKKELLDALKVYGRERQAYAVLVDNCPVAESFIGGGWRNKRRKIRWTVENVAKHFRRRH